jgi:hypothetical protein
MELSQNNATKLNKQQQLTAMCQQPMKQQPTANSQQPTANSQQKRIKK